MPAAAKGKPKAPVARTTARASTAATDPGSAGGPAGPRVISSVLGALQAAAAVDVLEDLELVARIDHLEAAQVAADWAAQCDLVGVATLISAWTEDSFPPANVIAAALAGYRLEDAVRECEAMIARRTVRARCDAAVALGLLGSVKLIEPALASDRRRALCNDLLALLAQLSNLDIKAAALEGLATCQWPDLGSLLQKMLQDNDWRARQLALQILKYYGAAADLPPVFGAFGDRIEDVRRAATTAAALILSRESQPGPILDEVIRGLSAAEPNATGLTLDLIAALAPRRFLEAARSAATSPRPATRRVTANHLGQSRQPDAAPLLEKLLSSDEHLDVRHAALKALGELVPARAAELALPYLGNPHPELRETAVCCLGAVHDSTLVDRLIPRARDPEWQVRAVALRALARYDDVRVLGEIVSSLNDERAAVRDLARKLLEDSRELLPVLERVGAGPDGKPAWQALAGRVKEITRWGERLGRLLLGKPVTIHQYRQGLGRTGDSAKASRIDIEVSDTPLTSGHPHGADIMRGLILHEIGHHLYDVGQRGHKAMRGIARSEGLGEIYDILRDERLERRLRSRNPEWGRYLDRLASYAFAQQEQQVPLEHYAKLIERDIEDTRSAIASGALPGHLLPPSKIGGQELVVLGAREAFLVPGLIPKLMLFLGFLRCRFELDLCPDPSVVRAVKLLPPNFRNLPHREVLEVARRIGDLIGRGDQHQRDLARLQQRIWHLGRMRWLLERALRGLSDTGQAPEWMERTLSGPVRARGGAPVGVDRRARPRVRGKLSPAARRMLGRLRGDVSRQGLPPDLSEPEINLNPEKDFPPLTKEVAVSPQPEDNARIVFAIRKHIRLLRLFLERLGSDTIEEPASRRGHRLDMAVARKAAWLHRPNILIQRREAPRPNAYIGLLIDRSGSMEGQKLARAKAFATLVAESGRRLPGIEGHVTAFDDDAFLRLGDFRSHAIGSLSTDQGRNNDAGALQRAAGLAFKSRKRNRLLIMISDGTPTECSFESLCNLVQRLEREHGVVCLQVAVDKLKQSAFSHHVDLSACSFDEALARFGRLLMQVTKAWR